MFDSLYKLSDIDIFIILSCSSISFSVLAIYVAKCFFSLDVRYKDNAVMANASSLVNVIYGVLAGFIALYLINNNNFAVEAVQREASATANIYRDSARLAEPTQGLVRSNVKTYVSEVINLEWPSMSAGKEVSDRGDRIINKISDELIAYKATTTTEIFAIHDILEEVKSLYNARQQRIEVSYSALSSEIWVVMIIGAVLALCINYLFGMNFYLHIVVVSAAAIMTSSILFLMVTLDKPFQGEFIVEPDAFRAVLHLIGQQGNSQ